jgi:ATP-dependent DNA helicase RecG
MNRLTAMEKTNDGFDLSMHDLEMRGEGDITTEEQSGVKSTLKILKVMRDREQIALAHSDVKSIMKKDSNFSQYKELQSAIYKKSKENYIIMY